MQLVTEGRLSAKEVGRRLNISAKTNHNWVKAHREGKLAELGKNHWPLSEGEFELARLRLELAQVIEDSI